MSINRGATRAGLKYESDLVSYIRSTKQWDTERLRLAGKEDEGDIVVKTGYGVYILEAKRCKSMDLSGWVKQAQAERDNYVKHRGADNYVLQDTTFFVVHHARGKSIGQSYVTTTLDEWLGVDRDRRNLHADA